ncbi:hypothetical protein ACYSNO_10020 [Enterococcus sp. LJL98]
MFLWLKTLYRKRTVTWPFLFYTIIWTLSLLFIFSTIILFSTFFYLVGKSDKENKQNTKKSSTYLSTDESASLSSTYYDQKIERVVEVETQESKVETNEIFELNLTTGQIIQWIQSVLTEMGT